MKKLFAILLVLVMVLALVACGNDAAPADDKKEDEKKEDTKPADDGQKEETKPADDGKSADDPHGWFGNAVDEDELLIYGIYKVEAEYFSHEFNAASRRLKELAEADGKTVSCNYVTCGNEDIQLCINYLDTAIADGADGILMCIPDQEMSLAIVEKCEAAGVPIVAGDDPLLDPEGGVGADGRPKQIAPAAGIDGYSSGLAAGEFLGNYVKEHIDVSDPTVGLMRQTMSMVSSCIPREQGMYDKLMEIVDFPKERTWIADSEGNQQDAYNATAAVQAGHPEIKTWIMTTSNECGVGPLNYLETVGLDKDSVILNMGCTGETCRLWDKGAALNIFACAWWSEFDVGTLTAEKLYDMMMGRPVPDEYYGVHVTMITPENYKADFHQPEWADHFFWEE